MAMNRSFLIQFDIEMGVIDVFLCSSVVVCISSLYRHLYQVSSFFAICHLFFRGKLLM